VALPAGFAPGVGLVALFFVSGFLALKIPAPPPTSAPTSWANTSAKAPKVKPSAAKLKTTARSMALVLIITLLLLLPVAKLMYL
jgi:hypothetical protein